MIYNRNRDILSHMGAKNSRRLPGPRRDTQAYYSSSIVPAIEQCMRHPATLLLALLAFVSSTTFCSPIAFIASGCTTMHQQFGSCRLPPISGQIKIFLSTSQPLAYLFLHRSCRRTCMRHLQLSLFVCPFSDFVQRTFRLLCIKLYF